MMIRSLAFGVLLRIVDGHIKCTISCASSGNKCCAGSGYDCGSCVTSDANVRNCAVYGPKTDAGTNSQKRCLSGEDSCGGLKELCHGKEYECLDGYKRLDGSNDPYNTECVGSTTQLDFGLRCYPNSQFYCPTADAANAVPQTAGQITAGSTVNFDCKPGFFHRKSADSDELTTKDISVTCRYYTNSEANAMNKDAALTGALGKWDPPLDTLCQEVVVPGCMAQTMLIEGRNATCANFNPDATESDGSCAECLSSNSSDPNSDCVQKSLTAEGKDLYGDVNGRLVCSTEGAASSGTCVECTNDDHCKSLSGTHDNFKNKTYCLDKSCVRCKEDSHCPGDWECKEDNVCGQGTLIDIPEKEIEVAQQIKENLKASRTGQMSAMLIPGILLCLCCLGLCGIFSAKRRRAASAEEEGARMRQTVSSQASGARPAGNRSFGSRYTRPNKGMKDQGEPYE